jgi:large subunit ribosomal protein L22
MIANAKGRYIRVSPMKIRQVIDLIRGKDVLTSQSILRFANKGCTKIISKVLSSAVSNAKQKGLMEDQLYISKILASKGTNWKRFRAASFGRATGILKKTSHLTIELDLITK